MRLDKIIQQQCSLSKKDIKKSFKNGLVTVNDKIVSEPSFSAEGLIHDVKYQGQSLNVPKHQYWQLNKPQNCVTANIDEDMTIFDLLPAHLSEDSFSIGRLDKNTTGLILVTNNGPLGYYLMQKKFSIWKKYYVELKEPLLDEFIELFQFGIIFADGKQCLPAKLVIVDKHRCFLTIQEGSRHQVKKMFLAVGRYVTKLHRVQIGPLKLDTSLKIGEYRQLTKMEVKALYFDYERGVIHD